MPWMQPFVALGRAEGSQAAAASAAPPRRPGQVACQWYMETGRCADGANCLWNHPTRPPASRASPLPASPSVEAGAREDPVRRRRFDRLLLGLDSCGSWLG